MPMFSSYQVQSATIVISAVPLAGYAAHIVLLDATYSNGATTDIVSQAEIPKTKKGVCDHGSPARLRLTSSTEEQLGIPAFMQISDGRLSALGGTNPSMNWFFNLWTAPVDATAAVGIAVDVTIYFNCQFYGRGDPVNS